MGTIIISESVSLDGFVQDLPVTRASSNAAGVARIGDRGREEVPSAALEEALATEAMLLGQRSYEWIVGGG